MKNNSVKLPAGWEIKKIKDLLVLEYGVALIKDKRIDGKYPVFGSNGVVGYHEKYLIEGPGIIIGRKGSIGKIVYSKENFWPIDTTFFVREKYDFNLRWLFYKLHMLGLEKMNSASGTPGLNRDEVYNLEIEVPPIEEQLKITDVLVKIDEGIDKLEEISRKSECLKKGLMDFLLKGKIRI